MYVRACVYRFGLFRLVSITTYPDLKYALFFFFLILYFGISFFLY